MGHANIIWQGDANDWTLRALAHCDTPTSPLNLSGPTIAHPRGARRHWRSGSASSRCFTGQRGADTAWLIDCSAAPSSCSARRRSALDRMLDWTADWVQRGGASLGKPTHYEARDGKY